MRRVLIAFGLGVLSALLLALGLWLANKPASHGPALPPQSPAPQPVDSQPSLRGSPTEQVQAVAAELTVHVRGADHGEPIKGARLAMLPATAGHAVRPTDAWVVEADEHGDITLPEERWRLDRVWAFSADGYRPAAFSSAQVLERASRDAVTVQLQSGSRVSGTVVTPWGDPVPDAAVVGYGRYGVDFDGAEEMLLPGPTTVGEIFRATSDADGRFALSGIGAFPIRVQASKSGFAWKADPEQDILFVDRESDQVRLVLRPRLVAGLRIIDAVSGELIRDFTVRAGHSEGPLIGRMEVSRKRPAKTRDLGFAFREGEWWLVGCSSDAAVGPQDGALVVARVTAPGYEDAADVQMDLRALGASGPPDPVEVHMTPTEPSARGSLRLRVTHAIDGLRLPWVDVRVEESRPAADSAPEPLAFTFRVDLGEDGRATRPLRLTPGRYRVRLAAGTGWATWSPPADDGWAEVTISDSPVETNVVLHYRATLLRISVAGESGGPIGMFNMMVHRLEPPPPGSRRAVVPMIASLSEESERWWLEFGHPYRSHLRMQPGAFDLLVAPGHYFVKVTKAGFVDPDPVDLQVAEGSVVPISFALIPVANEGDGG